jgi:hypothetical protein
MNRERFISLVKNPALLRAEDTPFLEELIKEFPFFQTAHLLTARCYKVTDSIHLQKQIKIAAAHITDRKVLYNLIENFQAKEEILINSEKIIVDQKLEVIPEQSIIELAISNEIPLHEKVEETNLVQDLSLEVDIEPINDNDASMHDAAITHIEKEVVEIIIEEETTAESNLNHYASIEPQAINIEQSDAFTIEEAEVPLEREIKLALAESLYLKEFEVIKEEKAVIEDKTQEISVEIAKNNENIGYESISKEQNVKVEIIEPEPTDFVAWLKKLKVDSRTVENTPPKIQEKKEEKLIEAFMEKPIQRPKAIKQEFYSPVNMAKQSVTDNDFFVTETLAKIYIKQGNFAKAIKVYQNLSLKNPEKNTFFAAQIKILKEQLHNKSGK